MGKALEKEFFRDGRKSYASRGRDDDVEQGLSLEKESKKDAPQSADGSVFGAFLI